MSNKLPILSLLLMLYIKLSPNAIADEIANNFMLLNNYNLPKYSTIWDRMSNGFKLPITNNDKVKYYEILYTKDKVAFNNLINNARPYLYYILNQTEKNGMPSEIALIPAVESRFNPKAQNPTDSYAGMWQFIPTTGKQFNLKQTEDFDDRQNIIKSTQAAVKHLNYLYAMFKQWDVAIGAYNWGEGNMYHAILESNQKIGNVEYNKLPLRQITANYVPKIIALSNIIRNPNKFGVKLETIDNKPYFAITSVNQTTTLRNLHKVANIDECTFILLNPQFKNNYHMLTNQEEVVLPIENQNIYYANINNSNNINTIIYNDPSVSRDLRTTSTINEENINNSQSPKNNMQNDSQDILMDTVYKIETQSMESDNDQNKQSTINATGSFKKDKMGGSDKFSNTKTNNIQLPPSKVTMSTTTNNPTKLIVEKSIQREKLINVKNNSSGKIKNSIDGLINSLDYN